MRKIVVYFQNLIRKYHSKNVFVTFVILYFREKTPFFLLKNNFGREVSVFKRICFETET